MRFKLSVLFVTLIFLSCATSKIPFGTVDQEKVKRKYVGQNYVLGSSMYQTDFFGVSVWNFADPRPFEILELFQLSGEKAAVGVPGQEVIPAGTPVVVKEVIYPSQAAAEQNSNWRLAPTAHIWVVLQRTPLEDNLPPLVLVLPREISSPTEFEMALGDVLKSQHWVTSWLTQRDPAELDAIFRKAPVVGMTWAGLEAALGLPRNAAQKNTEGMLEFVADYGDLQVTVEGNVVRRILSVRAEAEIAQKQALAKAGRLEEAPPGQALTTSQTSAAVKKEQPQELPTPPAKEVAIGTGPILVQRQNRQEEPKAAKSQSLTTPDLATQKADRLVAEKENRKIQAALKAARKDLERKLASAQKDLGSAAAKAQAAETKAADTQQKQTVIVQKIAALEADAKSGRQLGLKVSPLSPQLIAAMNLGQTNGAFVTSVVSGGEADEAGLRTNDVIVTIDAKPVDEPKDVMQQLVAQSAEKPAAIGVLRGGATVELSLKKSDPPEIKNLRQNLEKLDKELVPLQTKVVSAQAEREAKSVLVADLTQKLAALESHKPRDIGLRLEPLSAQLAAVLGLSSNRGAFVAEVTKGGDAERAGLCNGDVVLKAQGTQVSGPAHFAELMKLITPSEELELELLRQGKKMAVKVVAPKTPTKADPNLPPVGKADNKAAPKTSGLTQFEKEPSSQTQQAKIPTRVGRAPPDPRKSNTNTLPSPASELEP